MPMRPSLPSLRGGHPLAVLLVAVAALFALGAGAEEPPCQDDADCRSVEYCDKASAQPTCRTRVRECFACSRDEQCQGGFCQGKPAGTCVSTDTLEAGAICCKDAQCRSGRCGKRDGGPNRCE